MDSEEDDLIVLALLAYYKNFQDASSASLTSSDQGTSIWDSSPESPEFPIVFFLHQYVPEFITKGLPVSFAIRNW